MVGIVEAWQTRPSTSQDVSGERLVQVTQRDSAIAPPYFLPFPLKGAPWT